MSGRKVECPLCTEHGTFSAQVVLTLLLCKTILRGRWFSQLGFDEVFSSFIHQLYFLVLWTEKSELPSLEIPTFSPLPSSTVSPSRGGSSLSVLKHSLVMQIKANVSPAPALQHLLRWCCIICNVFNTWLYESYTIFQLKFAEAFDEHFNHAKEWWVVLAHHQRHVSNLAKFNHRYIHDEISLSLQKKVHAGLPSSPGLLTRFVQGFNCFKSVRFM